MRTFPRSIRTLWASLALVVAAAPMPQRAAAGTPGVTSITQTVRSAQQDYGGVRGSYLTSYTGAGLRTREWDLRASLSLLSWRDDGGEFVTPDESGPGSVLLTVGRRLWATRSDDFSARIWLRLKGKIPLQEEFDATGSGEFDWGGSVYAALRFGAVSILAEFGRLDRGSPTGIDYESPSSIFAIASYLPPGARFYPMVGLARSSPLLPGDPSYGEVSAGLGAVVSTELSLAASFAWGTTDISPMNSVSVSAWLRL